MSRFYKSKSLCASLCAFSCVFAHADSLADFEELMPDAMGELATSTLTSQEPIHESIQAEPVQVEPVDAVAPKPAAKPKISQISETPFRAFTGKVKGRKVRMRLQPDLDARIIQELDKNELISIVADKGDFWAVEPSSDTKAYIFRSFVLDNVVEGNRVNVRLEPNLEAPVIGHLNAGDQIVGGVISAQNNKWLEISPPAETVFYVAKDYIEYAGGPEVKAQLDKRKATLEQLFDANSLLGQSELRKPFQEIDFERINHGFNRIINEYTDFPDHVEQAKEALASFQEAYLQKRINYLESLSSEESYTSEEKQPINTEALSQVTDKMRMWEPVEEALYLSWANMNDKHEIDEFYEDQQLAAVVISGILEAYNSPVKAKPGDFIVRDGNLPVGYVYSTHINLQNLVGKKVALKVSARPNNNFAFPAYYVLSVE
jgi:hypothetical protein